VGTEELSSSALSKQMRKCFAVVLENSNGNKATNAAMTAKKGKQPKGGGDSNQKKLSSFFTKLPPSK